MTSEPSINSERARQIIATKYVNSALKRSFDILVSLILLPFAILILIPVLVVYPFFGGLDIFYKHQRVGRNGRVFNLYKIRSLIRNHNNPRAGNDKNDGTIIPVIGYFLRQSRLDELPQIWNILRGDMSWVGPRPEQVDFVEICITENKYYNDRHLVKPGITGLAQIANPNATMDDYAEKLVYDINYIERASILLDIRLLVKSVLVIVK
jgi:lipopolysaccharide/colanic/teichoic acid biosynthesis glycosyltransferase